MLSKSTALVVESKPEDHKILEFKPENNPVAGPVDSQPDKQTPAKANLTVVDTGGGNLGFKPETTLKTSRIGV